MKTDASVRIATLGAVLEVSFDRTTYSRQLATYLMVPSGLQINLQKRVVFALDKGLVGQDSLFGFFGTGFGDKGLVELFIAGQPVLQMRLRLFGCTLHNRPIGFSDLFMGFEHLVEARERLASTGKEYYSTRRPVQTVRYPQKDLAGLVVLGLDVGFDGLAQRRVTRLITLHNFVAGLVDGNNMVVFV